MKLFSYNISKEEASYLKRKFKEAGKDYRRRKRFNCYDTLKGDDYYIYIMLVGIGEYINELWSQGNETVEVVLTEVQANYIRVNLPRLYRKLNGDNGTTQANVGSSKETTTNG
jgi:hypothetical protein